MKRILILAALALTSCAHHPTEFDRGVIEGMAQCQFSYDKWNNQGFVLFCKENPGSEWCKR